MNNILKYCSAFFVIFSGWSLSGCSDEDVPTPTSGNTSGSVTAVVNGAAWESSDGNYRIGTKVVPNGAMAYVGPGDTLTLMGVQVSGADTTAIVMSVKLTAKKIGSYKIRSGSGGDGNAYFLRSISGNALQQTKEQYRGGVTNGDLQITKYDLTNYSVTGNFGFSMSATGETTYTVIAGRIDNVTF